MGITGHTDDFTVPFVRGGTSDNLLAIGAKSHRPDLHGPLLDLAL